MPLLQDMTWPQAAAGFQRSDLVVVPIGSTEQHGPHLPLSTDFLVAQHIGERGGAELDALVAPVLPFGYAPYHLASGAGAISVRLPMSRLTPSGNLGVIDPWGASARLGREILDAVVAYLVAFGEEFKTVPLGG